MFLCITFLSQTGNPNKTDSNWCYIFGLILLVLLLQSNSRNKQPCAVYMSIAIKVTRKSVNFWFETHRDKKGQLLIIKDILSDGIMCIKNKQKVTVINSIVFLQQENKTKKWKYSPEIKKSFLGRAPFWFTCSSILHDVGCEKGFSAGL